MRCDMRTICIVTATRAEYGLLRPVVQKVAASDELDLQLVVTGAHLCPRLGETVHEIENDGFPIAARRPIFTEDAGEPAWREASHETYGVRTEPPRMPCRVRVNRRPEERIYAKDS